MNRQSTLGELLLNSPREIEYYSCTYLKIELERLVPKIMTASKLSLEQVSVAKHQLLEGIQFISDELIPYEYWANAAPLLRDIDMDDIPFVALNDFLDGKLWTGDKRLLEGLRAKGYDNCITTEELLELIRI